jgi:predicted PurR-regulated permease PerM
MSWHQYKWSIGLIILIIFCSALYAVKAILLPFILAFAVAYFLDPAADFLEERYQCSRLSAVSIICTIFILLIVVILLLLGPLLVEQVTLLMDKMPSYLMQAKKKLLPRFLAFIHKLDPSVVQNIEQSISNSAGQLTDALTVMIQNAWRSGMALINILSLLVITPVVTFYVLRDWDVMVATLHRLIPPPYQSIFIDITQRIDQVLSSYVRGQTKLCLILACYYSLGFAVIGLPFGAVIGVITGLLSLLPYIGYAIGSVAAVAVAFVEFHFSWPFWAVIAVLAIGQILEGQILLPRLVGHSVGLHPVWLMFALLAGGQIAGVVGMLVSIPVSAVIGVAVRYSIEHLLAKNTNH